MFEYLGTLEVTLRCRSLVSGGVAAQLALGAEPRVTVFSAGTDGIDGPTDAAGALSNSETLERAARAGLDGHAYLMNNDSYHFFEPLNALVKTGPTGTNVMDVRILLIA